MLEFFFAGDYNVELIIKDCCISKKKDIHVSWT
jgi:hypothetical protein